MTATATAHCGGHITLLFSIDKSSSLMRSQGSRGAGFTIQHGVFIQGALLVRNDQIQGREMNGVQPDAKPEHIEPEDSTVRITDTHGQPLEDPTLYLDFIQACREATLLRNHEYLEVQVRLECPVSQGFGMSAAGLVALGRLVHALTGRGRPLQYEKIAHRIERLHGAGLGDVLGLSVGGVELRTQPGAPGWPGDAVSFPVESPVLLVWDPNEERHTASYIDDPVWQSTITAAGETGVSVLNSGLWKSSRWRDLLEQSRAFAEASGMLEETVRANVYRAVLGAVQDAGMQAIVAARLCMLGSSVVVLPRRLDRIATIEELEALAEALSEVGLSTMMTAVAPVNPRSGETGR